MIPSRVIQIATSAVIIPAADPVVDQAKVYQTLFALCADGSLWARECLDGVQHWVEIPSPSREQRKAFEAAQR